VKLSDYASDVTSQFGENGVTSHLLDVIGERHRVCVEFGAGDGLSCSNTAHLWRDQGWKALLVEPDANRYEQLVANTAGYDVITKRAFVTPTGPNSITAMLGEEGISGVDFLSLDVDGDDRQILEALECRPRIICAETNPTVPPHLEIYQTTLGDTFGASLLAMIRTAAKKNYTFVGATYCNAFFVVAEEAEPFADYETDPAVLFGPGNFTYMVTDFYGRTTLCGQALPWEAKEPYVMPLECSAYLAPVCDDPAYIRLGFERQWGPARWFTAATMSRAELTAVLLEERPPLVCIDLTAGSLNPLDWMWIGAEAPHYRASLIGRVLGLVLQEEP